MGEDNINSKIIFAALILFVLLGLTCVSAADSNHTDIADRENSLSTSEISDDLPNQANAESLENADLKADLANNIYVNGSKTDDGDGSVANPYNNLKSAFTNADDDYTINIAPGTYTGSNNVGLTIEKKLTLTCWTIGDVILDGENNSQIFTVKAADFYINGLTFINGNGYEGGAICFENNGTITNCNFANNTASSYGGAIYFNKNARIEGSNFSNNRGSYGGAVYTYGRYTTINNSKFDNNTATLYDGGAVQAQNVNLAILYNCTFTNNNATGNGGGAKIARGIVRKCEFINNTANGYGALNIYSTNGIVEDCTFTSNYCDSKGGALQADRSNITNCIFNNNAVEYSGGAIDGYGNNITNCSFNNNRALQYDGGAVCGGNRIINCTFTNNSAKNGGAIEFEQTSTVINCTFTNNHASDSGGAINFYIGGNVINCNFTGNSAPYG